MVGGEQRDGRFLVGDAQRRRRSLDGERIRSELRCLQAAGAVVLRDDGAARLDPREQAGEIVLEVGALVEGAHANDDGVEALEFFRGEVRAGEAVHDVAHLLKTLRDVVAGTGEVTNREAVRGQSKARHSRPGWGLKQLNREVIVADFVALVGKLLTADLGGGGDATGGRFGRGRDEERDAPLVADVGETKILRGGLDLPPGGCVEAKGAAGVGAGGGRLDRDGLGGAGSDEINFRIELHRNGRDHREPASHLRRGRAGDDLHGLVSDDESLTVDGEDMFEGNGRRIFRATNQRRVVDPRYACGAVGAEPVGLREQGIGRQRAARFTDERGACDKIGGFGRGQSERGAARFEVAHGDMVRRQA